MTESNFETSVQYPERSLWTCLSYLPETSVKTTDLSGKQILITGGAGFLGLHFAEAVAEMGGFPILLDMHPDSLRSLEQAERLMDSLWILPIAASGSNSPRGGCKVSGIDVLINSAAFRRKTFKLKAMVLLPLKL